MTILNGQSLVASAVSGLASAYSELMNNKSSKGAGLTLKDLSNLPASAALNLGSNYTFLQYLTSNFSNLDEDGDGEITSGDISNLMNTTQSKGLTYNEIQQLCSSGSNDTLLSTVLTYFNKIDADGDGRVTTSEITKFSFDNQRNEVEAKYKSYRASNSSLYYNDGVEDDTSSVLDSLRPNLNNATT